MSWMMMDNMCFLWTLWKSFLKCANITVKVKLHAWSSLLLIKQTWMIKKDFLTIHMLWGYYEASCSVYRRNLHGI